MSIPVEVPSDVELSSNVELPSKVELPNDEELAADVVELPGGFPKDSVEDPVDDEGSKELEEDSEVVVAVESVSYDTNGIQPAKMIVAGKRKFRTGLIPFLYYPKRKAS